MRRVLALAVWCYAVWVLLSWQRTAEVLGIGAVACVALAVVLAPLGEVVEPWRVLAPRRLAGLLVLLLDSLRQIVRANVALTIRIWRPSRPLTSGMVVVPTRERSDGGLAAVGLISSLVVDNQIVDVDRARHELLYHAVEVPTGGRRAGYEAINGPLERRLSPVLGDQAGEGEPDA